MFDRGRGESENIVGMVTDCTARPTACPTLCVRETNTVSTVKNQSLHSMKQVCLHYSGHFSGSAVVEKLKRLCDRQIRSFNYSGFIERAGFKHCYSEQ